MSARGKAVIASQAKEAQRGRLVQYDFVRAVAMMTALAERANSVKKAEN